MALDLVLSTPRAGVVCGDALEFLRTLATSSFDLILDDPPYGQHTHANLGKERRADGRRARDALEFPPMTPELIAEFAAEKARVSRGWIATFTDDRSIGLWGNAFEAAGADWVRTGYWVKTSPMPQMTGDRPGTGAEAIVIAHAARPDGRRMSWRGGGHAAAWRGPRDPGAEHPNQKPAWLIQALLGCFAPDGGYVLDPFLGSGTIFEAAFATARIPGEQPAETSCPRCAKKLAEAWQPPIPTGLRVAGCDADPRWARRAADRARACGA